MKTRFLGLNCPQILKRPAWTWMLATVLIAIVATATWVTAQEDPEPGEVGLRGIFPYEVPEDLTPDAFTVLGGNWEEWGQKTSELVIQLYEDETLDVAAQRDLVDNLQRKLGVMEVALKDRRYRQLHDEIGDLYGKLSRRVDLADAILETLALDADAARAARLAAAKKDVADNLEDLESYLADINNSQGWLEYLHADDVKELLGKETVSDTKLLGQVSTKIKGRGQLKTAEQRNFLGREPFLELEDAVSDYLEISRAKPLDKTALREKLAALVEALETYEFSRSIEAAHAARQAYSNLRKAAPDGGELISEALRSHYFNYNMKIVASESLLNRLIAEDRTDDGPVDDFILGAKVDGTQTTNSTVGLDLRPDNQRARFDITLRGTVNSSTQGVTDEATVYTQGTHYFWARKPVTFDGRTFKTSKATIQVDANNYTYDARTGASGVPLIGGVTENIAVRTAQRKRSQSEAIARQRVSSRVLPQFNRDADKQFSQANREFDKKITQPLKRLGLYPSAYSYRTTDEQLRVNTRLMSDAELGGSLPSPALEASDGLLAHFHETVMNNAIDRMQLGGRTLTEKELVKEFEGAFSDLLGRPVEFPEAEEDDEDEDKTPTTFVFEGEDPIRVKASGGQLALVLRCGFKQEGEDDIPAQIITVPFNFKIDGDNVVITSGTVQVLAVVQPKNLSQQIVRAGVVRKKIKSALPDRTVDRHFDVTLNEGEKNEKKLELSLAAVKAIGGWLSVAIE